MKTTKETWAQIIEELRDGKSEEFLMKKHGVSGDNLSKLKLALIAKGLLDEQESTASEDQGSPKKRSIDAGAATFCHKSCGT